MNERDHVQQTDDLAYEAIRQRWDKTNVAPPEEARISLIGVFHGTGSELIESPTAGTAGVSPARFAISRQH